MKAEELYDKHRQFGEPHWMQLDQEDRERWYCLAQAVQKAIDKAYNDGYDEGWNEYCD